MDDEKKAFLLYANYRKQFEMLEDSEAGRLIKALFSYFSDGSEPNLDGMALMLFTIISDNMDRDQAKWEETRRKRSQAGKRSGEVRRKKQSETNLTSVPFVEQNEQKSTNSTVSVNDTVKVTVNDTVSVNDTVTSTEKEKRKRFTKPTLAEVERYINENSLEVDAEQFIDHYESNGWKIGTAPMKSWEATLRNWDRRAKQGGGGYAGTNSRTEDFDRSQYQ